MRFGAFEVDLGRGELRKNGLRIKLHAQPFAVLAMLLEHPGDLVSREEIQQKLWGTETFVDFEHGLNKAVNKLREALNDNADNPRFIETLPRRGYRFIAPIATPLAMPAIALEEDRTPRTIRRMGWAVGVTLAGTCALLVVSLYFKWSARLPRVLRYRQLTTGLKLKGESSCGLATSPLVTDGVRVFFSQTGSPVSQVSVSGGEIVNISAPFSCFAFSDISPDRTELVGMSQSNWTVADQPLWTLKVASGEARRVGDLTGHAAAWSPDGKRIVYATGTDGKAPGDVYIAAKDGNDARRLVRFEKGFVYSIRWSPDGRILRVMVWQGSNSLWEVSADGSNLHRIELFPGETERVRGQLWTPDGRYSLLTVRRPDFVGRDIWVLREAGSGFTSGDPKPMQLTTGGMSFWDPIPSPDGKQIFAIGGQERGELVRYDLSSHRLEPFLSGISADHLDFSRDGKWVTYVTFPERSLWRSRVDGTERLQLTTPPFRAALPRWSPDGRRIVFDGALPDTPFKIYVVSAEGGRPDVIAENLSGTVDPTWTPDGNSLIVAGFGDASDPKILSVDFRTGRASVVPGSQGLYSPRVSPDGRFIVALDTPANRKLFLFDWQTQKWTELLDGKIVNPGWPQWSADSRYIYLRGTMFGKRGFSLYRLPISDHKLERVAAVEVPEGITGMFEWIGVAPDGSPIVLRDQSIQEIYALDVDLP